MGNEKITSLSGHGLMEIERFMPDVRHMIVFKVLDSKSPVGSPGEHCRLFLSDTGYRKALDSESRGEIRIVIHRPVENGKI